MSLLVLLTGSWFPAATGAQGTPPAVASDYAPGQIIVSCMPGRDLGAALAAADLTTSPALVAIASLRASIVQVPVGTEQEQASRLRSQPSVRYAELNYRVHAVDEPDDPYWPQQWSLAKIRVADAWDITFTSGVIVALLDSGADIEHPDLQGGLWTNAGEIASNGLDDDGNGKPDDVHGWHFFQQWNGSTYQAYENRLVDDENGHGTHVTGIVAAVANNGIGIAGVSRGARAMIVRVLDERGEGWYSDVAAGIAYAVDNGAKIINLSLGGSEPSQVLQDAIDYAYQHNALVIASSGNDGGAVLYPAAGAHVLAVAATDAEDRRCSFSNYGPAVDIAAPGESILSTWPWLDGYYRKRGTSMASPHVAGAAALLWSWRPDYGSEQVEQRLKETADDVNSATYPGPDPYLGWGRLNVHRALSALAPGPTATPSLTPTSTATPTPSSTLIPTTSPTPTATAIPSSTPMRSYVIFIPLGSWVPLH
jgi:subtilisin family serine protease